MKNTAATQQLISSIALSGTDTSQFTLVTGGTAPCSSLTSLTLAAGASCTLLVSAKPTTVGNKGANLTVTSGGSSINAPLTVTSFALAITYYGNANDSGAVPTDGTAYTFHAPVTVLDNSGGLAKSGYTFSGWNMAVDGSGVNYQPGTSFAISADTVLYARWTTTAKLSLVSWWRAEGNALDTTGGLVGTAASGMTYTSGKV
ncbi:InlB B-repeat-containing protein, partial [bacterium]|nr:InlB B-repeat-containing protein [bacterium]